MFVVIIMRFMMKYWLILFVFVSANLIAQTPQIKWWYDVNDNSFGQSALGDIDGDGKYEVVFGCYRNDSMVYALNADDGSLLWKFNASGSREGCNDTAPLIFDVDGDGQLDVIVASSCNPYTYCFDGATGAIKWQTRTRGSDSPPTIADIDGDGILEILHGQFGGYVICMNAKDGVKKWDLAVDVNSWIQTAPTIVDLDGDGRLDFVVASWNFDKQSKVYAYRGYDQELLWTYDIVDYAYHGTTVVDISGDGNLALVLGDYGGNLYALNAKDGELLWKFKSDYYIGSPVSSADLNGDGNCELVFSSYFRYYALKGDGSILWQYSIPGLGQSFRGAALADVDNDGLPDVIFGTSNGLLTALKGVSGAHLWTIDLQEHMGKELAIDHAPVVADFDGDGELDVFVVGGYTKYPEFQDNYGRAYAVSVGKGKGPDWTMFQNNWHRTGSLCYTPASVPVIQAIKFKLSPNPATDYIFINNNDAATGELAKSVMIYNTLGQCVSAIPLNIEGEQLRIDVSHLSPGVYFVRFGNRTERFVKW